MRSVAELEDRLSQPGEPLIEDLRKLDGDILVLGAGGKLGPSLVRLALRGVAEAGTGVRVIAVSRFNEPGLADALADAGAVVVPADVADERQLAELPDAPNVVYLVGTKFGTSGGEHATWAANAYLPGRVATRFAGARIAGLSTGNVYPLLPVGGGGATEDTRLDPVGEYAMSCLGRERIFEHFSERDGTPVSLIRLNYAVELRYGVLVDIAEAVWHGRPVDLTTGYANVVWQGYANQVTLRSLRYAASPPYLLNLTGPETVSVRQLAVEFGRLLDREPVLLGEEAPTALLSNAARCHGRFGYPDVPLAELVEHTAAWVAEGLPRYGKPTHFQSRDGKF
ncbi:MAG: NAD-dependent epimerase/dehydratase family protein [Micromonosporaceae bacterium]